MYKLKISKIPLRMCQPLTYKSPDHCVLQKTPQASPDELVTSSATAVLKLRTTTSNYAKFYKQCRCLRVCAWAQSLVSTLQEMTYSSWSFLPLFWNINSSYLLSSPKSLFFLLPFTHITLFPSRSVELLFKRIHPLLY